MREAADLTSLHVFVDTASLQHALWIAVIWVVAACCVRVSLLASYVLVMLVAQDKSILHQPCTTAEICGEFFLLIGLAQL